MAWIKRNLIFVAGGVAALLLLGVAAFYLFSNLSKDSAVTEELNQQISELRRIYEAPVHPGTDEVNNIAAAKKQQQEIRDFLAEARKLFVPVPTYQKTDDRGFNNLLLNTIYELQTGASNAGVALPPDYKFTFLAQSGKLSFTPGSIEPWTAQLSEIKTICNILYQARINALEGLRRVPVSPDDVSGTPDYLNATIVTNDISIISPYEVTFRSFSGELGEVMNGILRSTNCLIVKTLIVEPSKVVPGSATGQPAGTPNTSYPNVPGARDGYAARFGVVPGAGPIPGASPIPSQATPGRPGVSTAPVVFLTEKPLHVTLLIDVVKIKPQH